jgi:hypothetical protein
MDFPLYKCSNCGRWFNRSIVSFGWPEHIRTYSNVLQALLEISWRGCSYCINCCRIISNEVIVILWKQNN